MKKLFAVRAYRWILQLTGIPVPARIHPVVFCLTWLPLMLLGPVAFVGISIGGAITELAFRNKWTERAAAVICTAGTMWVALCWGMCGGDMKAGLWLTGVVAMIYAIIGAMFLTIVGGMCVWCWLEKNLPLAGQWMWRRVTESEWYRRFKAWSIELNGAGSSA